jgi:macrodomain Ter protein organizer (MatP/YcbG family)
MARAPYQITKDDSEFAYSYIQKKLRTRDFTNDYESSEEELHKTFEKPGQTKKIEALNKWCDKWLSTAEWKKLKVAIRQRRKRSVAHLRYDTMRRNITISYHAFKLLQKISERDNVTYSYVLERCLPKELESSPAGRKRLRR